METKNNNKKSDFKLTKHATISIISTVLAMAATNVIYFLTTV